MLAKAVSKAADIWRMGFSPNQAVSNFSSQCAIFQNLESLVSSGDSRDELSVVNLAITVLIQVLKDILEPFFRQN